MEILRYGIILIGNVINKYKNSESIVIYDGSNKLAVGMVDHVLSTDSAGLSTAVLGIDNISHNRVTDKMTVK